MRGQIVVQNAGGPAASSGTWEVAPEQPSGVKAASLPCEQERCVNFCLVPLSPSPSKWSTSATLGERLAEVAAQRWAVGGRCTPHTGSLCAPKQWFALLWGWGAAANCSKKKVGGREGNIRSWVRRGPYCCSNYHLVIIMLTQMIICRLI